MSAEKPQPGPGPAPKVGQVEGLDVSAPRCPYCHEDVAPGDPAKQACNHCMAWHHSACWTEQGGCAACQAKGEAIPASQTPDRRLRAIKAGITAVVMVIAFLGLYAWFNNLLDAGSPRVAEAIEGLPDAERVDPPKLEVDPLPLEPAALGPLIETQALIPPWVTVGQRFVSYDKSLRGVATMEVTALGDGLRWRMLHTDPPSNLGTREHDWHPERTQWILDHCEAGAREVVTISGIDFECVVYEWTSETQAHLQGHRYWISVMPGTDTLAFPGTVRNLDADGEVHSELRAIETP